MAFLAAVLLVLFSGTHLPTSKADDQLGHRCSGSNGNFTVNSTFEANLNLLLRSLTNASATGFSTSIVGTTPDRVYGFVLCRGDVDPSACGSCLAQATSDLPQICPYNKAAVVWYDNCLLRYSNQRFISTIDTSERSGLYNTQSVNDTDAARFNVTVRALFHELAQYAVQNSTAPPLFAAGEIEFGRQYQKVYGLVQCTRDIAAADCDKCLQQAFGNLPWCCFHSEGYSIGGRVLFPTCNFRYEVGSFYNWSTKLSFPSVDSAAPPVTSPTPVGSGNKKKVGVVIAITISIGVTSLLLMVIGCICIQKKRAPKRRHDSEVEDDITIDSLLFDLATIKYATNNFSQFNKLGQGGFGSVYKGVLQNGKEIAVKRLSAGSGQGIDELKNEVVLLAKQQHRNLVDLLGVCLEGEEKLLVYEYVANRSLDTVLFDPAKKKQLNWERRYNIVRGIAKGMLYLHEESQLRIIHRDLKASNVLLDAELNPKISDFGLARLFGGDQTQASTNRVVGTFGYMSPEYAMRGQFSTKSDIFSFGVLLLEIVTGRKNSDFFRFETSENSSDLLSYVWEHWSHGSIFTILDPSFSGSISQAEALRCIQIGLLCVQESPTDRPTMSAIVLMLSSNTISINVPAKPAFLPVYSKEQSFKQGLSTETIEGSTERFIKRPEAFSPNDMSVTELDPR